MAFSASILHITLLVAGFVLLPIPTTAFASGVTAANATAAVGGDRRSPAVSSSTAAAAANNPMYICYLCRERNTLMIKWCPLDEDDCHIACLSADSSSSRGRRAVGPAPGADGGGTGGNALAHGPNDDGDRNGDDCYVMKLYPDGSWVIVDVVSCRAVSGCYLVCSWADSPVRDAAGGETTPAVARSPPLPLDLPEFQRCGDQQHITAPRPAVPAGV